jgi:uncharacterized phage protein gp47/JayE
VSIQIKSFNQILGDMVRKIVADTPLNDLNPGSVLLTLLEAAAANDFENSTSILNILELLNIDAVKNNDLDSKAGDFGLSRRTAIRASGLVNIFNTNITKRSTGLYVIKPAPIAGQTKLYVNDTAGWAPTGSLYIGRGTPSFEGPITYTSITVFPTYSEITLSSALQKDHLISDVVIDSQGEPDRLITAGTIVKIPANSQSPEVQYSLLREAVIPSGEDSVTGVEVVALNAGSIANAGINTITLFDSPPFLGAAVSNSSAFSNGRDIETDTELRNRLKSYSITLARGTAPSIIESVIGVSDQDDSKQVTSAVISEPVKVGAPSILYIDDGSGFQPSYEGQSVDKLLDTAEGSEEFLQLANFPIPRPQVVNSESGPFSLTDGMSLTLIVDGKEESVFFSNSQFLNISAATLPEIVAAINSQSVLFKARLTENSQYILLYPSSYEAETIRVASLKTGENVNFYANSLLKFPTNEFSYIALYQNSTRLKEKSRSAELVTTPYAQWNINSTENIIVSVDGTPEQNRSFALTDFAGATSFESLVLQDWVDVFNSKFAGLNAEATPNQNMIIKSNKIGDSSSIEILGGSLLNKWFANLDLKSFGQTSQFELNRQTGNLRILSDILPGDTITAGVEDAKGFAISSETFTGTYNLSADSSGRPAEMVVVVDSNFCDQKVVDLLVGSTLDITSPDSSTMRIVSNSLNTFANLLPGDFLYIAPKTTPSWLALQNSGLFKIKSKGNHNLVGVDTFIDVSNASTVIESSVAVSDPLDIKAFRTDGFPQIWRGSYLSNPPAEPLTGIITSLGRDLVGVRATIFKSKSIKITSTTELGGSIALPVCSGNVANLFTETKSAQKGNEPHISNKVSSKSLVSLFKRTQPTSSNVFLNRHVYSDIKANLTATSTPDQAPFSSTYSEELQSSGILTDSNVEYNDYVSVTRGSNRGQIRTIKAKLAGDAVGTQQSTARTEIDYSMGDEVQLVKPISISPDDNIVFILDKDATSKTIDIKMSRTGRVNSGSGITSFTPTTTEFSAFDQDNEPGIDFNNLNVWGKNINNTDFSDYAVWMRARNWYSTGGLLGVDGKMLVRASQFGPNGEKIKFSIKYPNSADQSPITVQTNLPSSTELSYIFGSGPARASALNPGYTIAVSGPYPDESTNFPNGSVSSGNYYDYTFSLGNLSSVLVGDILSINSGSGISNANSGQFKVMNKSGFTVRVFNPNATPTSPGAPETISITTIADVVGTPTEYTVDTVADVAGSLHQTYFIIYDAQGSVAVWYDVNNTGVVAPPHGANRAIKVANVVSNDSANDVATKTAQVIALDNAFSVSAIGNQLTITNLINGSFLSAVSGTSGFAVSTVFGSSNDSLDGKYFILNDENGSVAVWYDVGNDGTSEPFHGANRSIRVGGVNYGDSATIVAAATVAAINPDLSFSASNVGPVISISNLFDGNVINPSAGTSGFSITSIDGSLSSAELITNANSILFFPLSGIEVSAIKDVVNESGVLEITPIGDESLTIETSTYEESFSVSHEHDVLDLATKGYISLFDGVNWVKAFDNTNPNFVFKTEFELNNVAPSIYSMNTAPNHEIPELGELFKLIPVTVQNIYHQFTQKALSQLPIVANVSISNDRKNVQITSKNLGSSGAIEVVGGNANSAKAYIIGESEISSDINGEKVLIKTQAFPDTFNSGDYVMLNNDKGVKRLSRLVSTDSIDISAPVLGNANVYFNPKFTNITATTAFTISDISGLYNRPAGFVWRWQHDGSASLAQVRQGDQIMAFGPTLSWDQGNKVGFAGDSEVAGLPIVSVNDDLNYVDVLNPNGKAMVSTAVGVGNTVQICPTPIIKWNLAHDARKNILSISRDSNIVTITCQGAHLLNSGDMIDLRDSSNLADATYGPITSISQNIITLSLAGADFNETLSGASLIKAGKIPTRYRLENLNFNNMIRLSRQDGASPRFVDSGVAVDDYISISGSTFSANNNGKFRIQAVDNDSLIIINESATDQLNTIRPFNNKGLLATWTANTNVVSGSAGAFKNVSVGDWIKKPEDSDDLYRQVVSMFPASPDTATVITLGDLYNGSTGISAGAAYDQENDYDKGVELKNINDISIFEGDSASVNDTLYIQNIINSNWFSPANIGSFPVVSVGTEDNLYRPFVKIKNLAAVAETNRLMSVDSSGVYLVEGEDSKFYSIRKIDHCVLDDINNERRAIYLTPANRSYKFSEANFTNIESLGKLNYSTDINVGVDGYLYYTGLLRRVQRIVDGFEPDAQNFPGRRAVGGFIETLPPLIRQVNLSLDITTNEGVNLGDITNNIKSVIINYVQGLGVGQDVILSEIIAEVMGIRGVAAATFTTPTPDTERITIASDEKAVTSAEAIGIA